MATSGVVLKNDILRLKDKTVQDLGLLGKGSFGKVFKVYDLKDKGMYAVKEICISSFKSIMMKRAGDGSQKSLISKLLREVKVLNSLNHSNVVSYHSCKFEGDYAEFYSQIVTLSDEEAAILEATAGPKPPTNTCGVTGPEIVSETSPSEETSTRDDISNVFNENTFVYIWMDFCESDLRKWLAAHPAQQDRSLFDIYSIMNQLANGLAYIHQKQIIHRDLKPSNIFIENKYNAEGKVEFVVVKIGDLGLARRWDESIGSSTSDLDPEQGLLSRKIGDPDYRSPEMAQGQEYGEKTDVYSIGLIFLELLYAFKPVPEPPGSLSERNSTFYDIRVGKYPWDEPDHPILKVIEDGDELDLLKRMTSAVPTDRPSANADMFNPAASYTTEQVVETVNRGRPSLISSVIAPQVYDRMFSSMVTFGREQGTRLFGNNSRTLDTATCSLIDIFCKARETVDEGLKFVGQPVKLEDKPKLVTDCSQQIDELLDKRPSSTACSSSVQPKKDDDDKDGNNPVLDLD